MIQEERDMSYCPKCQHPIAEGAKFCNHCGTQIPEAPRQKVCANCGQPIQPGAAFCNHCGTPAGSSQPRTAAPVVTPAAPQKPLINTAELGQKAGDAAKKAGEAAKKAGNAAKSFLQKVPKKFLILGAAALALVIVLIIVISAIAGAGAKDNYALYVKDDNLYFNSLSGKNQPLEVTDRLEYPTNSNSLSSAVTMAKDGERLFYPDRGSYGSDFFTLYYRDIRKSNSEGVKIDSNISTYSVNEDGTLVTYLKEDTLYQHNLKDKTKVSSDVEGFQASADGKKLVFLDDEGTLYTYTSGKDKEKIDSDVFGIEYISEDLSVVAYTAEDTLYIYTGKGEPQKIKSGVYSTYSFQEDGTCYFTVMEDSPVYLWDFIDDDMAATDAEMTQPDWSADQDTWDAWYAKENRDYIRENAKEYTISQDSYTLYYYNGKEAVKVCDNFNSYEASSSSAPVLAFTANGDTASISLPISEYTSIWEMADAVEEERGSSSKLYFAKSGELTEVALEDVWDVGFSADGKEAFILADYNSDKGRGDLYKATVGKEPAQFDTDVSISGIRFLDNGDLLYFKDVKNDEGDLYVEKKLVESDVYCYYLGMKDGEKATFLFYTDYSDSKSEGTLNLYKNGKVTKVADDARDAMFLECGDILYLADYSTNRGEGDLYRFTGKKSEKIDEDVQGIVFTDSPSAPHFIR